MQVAADVAAEPTAPRAETQADGAGGRLRWVLDTDVDSSGAALSPAGSLLRLYGFRGESDRLFAEGKEAEWVVDAAAGGAPVVQRSGPASDKEKYFLVPEDEEAARRPPIEIEPVHWSASQLLMALHPLERGEAAPVYRVYILPGPRMLRVLAPPPVEPGIFPSLRRSDAHRLPPPTFVQW